MKKNQLKLLIFSLILTSTIWVGCESKKESKDIAIVQIAEETTVETSWINPDAVDLLQRGTNFLSELEQFSVKTQSTYEDVLKEGYRVDFETSGKVIVNRPNQIRIERYGLRMHQIFYFDGESFALNNPYDKIYAVEPLSGNIEDMFHTARDKYGLGAPASDLIYNNSFSLLMQNVNFAEVIGKEMIGEVMCDHLLFIRTNVSFQIWISDKEPYLPYKYVVTDTSNKNLLSFATVMSNWDTAPDVSDEQFIFVPSADNNKIIFLETDPKN